MYKISDNADLFISSVSLYELYMGATNKEKENDVKSITEDLSVLPFTNTVAQQAAQIVTAIEIIQPLRTIPYGKEFYITDPDGYIIGFLE